MKKDNSMNKLLSCKKRKSTSKLNHFDHATMLRKTHASMEIITRAVSKRKVDVCPTALQRQHCDGEASDTKNATFDQPNIQQTHVLSHDTSALQRFLGPSKFSTALRTPPTQVCGVDQPPSLPRRSGSIENTHLPLPTTFNKLCHNARFTVSVDKGNDKRNASLPARSLREHNPFWDSTSRVDMPPSYHRHESVSTQLNKMCISNNRKMTGKAAPALSLPFQHAIEIRPGVVSKVRGAQETWSCLKRDFYQSSTCQTCKIELTCIQDLDFVLCPSCGQLTTLRGSGGGVGLGFTFSDLRRWELGNQRIIEEVEPLTVNKIGES